MIFCKEYNEDSSSPARVIVADDHPVFLLGLKTVLANFPESYDVVGEASDTSTLFSLLATENADVLISDFNMPSDLNKDGLWMISQIRKKYPKLTIVVVTMINDRSIVNSLLKYDVKAILNKMSLSHELVEGLNATAGNQEPYLSEHYRPTPHEKIEKELTAKEFSVVILLAQGKSVNEISKILYRTKQTISAQKRSAMKKLGLKNESELYFFLEQACMKS